MHDGPNLTPSEERIIEFLRAGTLDAEIAVRLGLSVGETKEKIERLRGRLGLKDRRELAGWRNGRAAGDEEIDWSRDGAARRVSEEPAVDEVEIAAPAVLKRFSRRSVLAMAGAGVVAVAGGGAGALALLRSGGNETPVSAAGDDATTSPAAEKTVPTPTAPPAPHPGLAAITEDPTAWLRVKLPAGGVIPFKHGVGFMNAETGAIEVVQLGGANRAAYGYGYQVSPRDTLVLGEFAGEIAPAGGLLNRQTGVSYTWDRTQLELGIIDDDHLLAREVAEDAQRGFSAGTGRYVVISPDLRPLAEFALPTSSALMPHGTAVSKDGSMLGLVTPDGQRAFLVSFERDGEVIEVPGNAPPNRFVRAESAMDGPGIRFVSVATGSDGTGLVLTVIAYDQYLTLTGDVAGSGPDYGNPAPLPSPDGRYRLRPGSLRARYVGLGDNEDWVYTDLLDMETGETVLTGETLFRVLSGHLYYGLGAHRRWLANSSAFVVEGADLGAPGESYGPWRTARRHYLVSTGGELEPLPRPPEWINNLEGEGTTAASYLAYWGGYEPSPHDPDLFAVGGLAVYNRRADRWFAPGNFVQPIGDDPWGGTSREIRFIFPPGGKDAAGPGTVLPPAVAYSPFNEQVRLRVARTGDCLNLRERPRADAAVLDCLVDGTEVVVVEPEHELGEEQGWDFPQGKPAFWSDDREEPFQMYVHVRAPSGQTGWVAIQYLEWA